MESWPGQLPKPTVQGYVIKPEDALLRTEMDAGPARQRRIFTHVPTVVTVRWRMNPEQFALFQSWFRHKAYSGAAWFSIILANGMGLQEQEGRFHGPYKAQPLFRGLFWEVTANLEIRDPPVMGAAALDLLLSGEGDAFMIQANRLHSLIHQSWPNHW
ncbi:hypothetical protein [Magnetococcus sp. PR-3]|uniref:hypothetical protein n=1 Tax=Magnetococcus sp. PR-3 TaxID=3120355 RepID=UPI002FCE28B9